MRTIETGSNSKPYEERYKNRLLSIAIISPMRKSQQNKWQKISVSRNESGVLQTERLWSEWYAECVICFEVAFQMSRATLKCIQEHNACLMPGRDAQWTLFKNLNYFPSSQYLYSLGCSEARKAFLILIKIFQLQKIYLLGKVLEYFVMQRFFWEVRVKKPIAQDFFSFFYLYVRKHWGEEFETRWPIWIKTSQVLRSLLVLPEECLDASDSHIIGKQ